MEKNEFLAHREREFQTTIKVLKAFPEEKGDLKPGEKSSSARQLARTFYFEEVLLQKLLKNKELDHTPLPPPPSIAETIKEFTEEFHNTNDLVRSMSDEELNSTATFFVAPKTPGEVPKRQLLTFFLFDSIHHRGQMTVYLRIVGSKVPSIYGPTADEPWM
jgi:uncharacterized damage-inducible protein DinB